MVGSRIRKGASRRSILAATGAAAVGITFLDGCSPSGGKTLNFYNWDTYIGPTTLDDFKAATGVTVDMSLFASNDELFAKLRAGNSGYDVIVPSNEFVTRMAQAGMLMELDRSKIPNFSNLLPEFQDAGFDPGRRYSMPYTWLVIGIGYRKSKVDGVPDSWKWLLDSDRYHQKISLLGESADLIRIAAKYKGHSVNGIPDSMISDIEQMLIRQKPHILKFHSDDGQDLLVSKEVDLVMEYNGDIAQVIRDDPDNDLAWVIPKEGSLLNQDTLCIPKGAPHVDEAHAFINYLLDAQAGMKIASEINYATPNGAARALMPDSYKNNTIVYPTPEEMARCEYGAFEGDERAQLYEEVFTRINAA
ncbi:MAG TPA: spermidine/putrescine ABC transporter substrate-binding protein [Caulobacterales bacterium]|nr:spermidine/putrescine ABC transporter substrate-binding protein [Caulobacterales bacterium]